MLFHRDRHSRLRVLASNSDQHGHRGSRMRAAGNSRIHLKHARDNAWRCSGIFYDGVEPVYLYRDRQDRQRGRGPGNHTVHA